MSVDFPRAWQIARAARLAKHEFECSYLQSSGGLLCDCKVLTRHPEYLDDVLQGAMREPEKLCYFCEHPINIHSGWQDRIDGELA
jgi:hypothetical protein